MGWPSQDRKQVLPVTPRDFAILMIVSVGFAAHLVLGRIVIGDLGIPALFYAAARFAVVSVCTLPWLLPLPRQPLLLCLIGVLIGGGSFSLTFLALATASPSSVAVVTQLTLPFTAILGVILLREKINGVRLSGIITAFLGAVIVMYNPGQVALSTGLLLAAASALAASLGTVLIKQLDPMPPIRIQAWVGLSSFALLSILSAIMDSAPLEPVMRHPWEFVAAVLFSALVVSIVSHTLYYSLLKRHDANYIATLMLGWPILAMLLGMALTGDTVDLKMMIGTTLILAGIAVSTTKKARGVASADESVGRP